MDVFGGGVDEHVNPSAARKHALVIYLRSFELLAGKKAAFGKAPVGFEVERVWTKQVTAALRDLVGAWDDASTELE